MFPIMSRVVDYKLSFSHVFVSAGVIDLIVIISFNSLARDRVLDSAASFGGS